MAVQTPSVQAIAIKPSYLQMKRAFDIIFTLLLLIPLLFVMAIVAILIRFDSKGPILFRQKRLGLNGREFTIFKFRSMYVNSDDSLHRNAIVHYMNGKKLRDEAVTNNSYKLGDDPRITRVGEFIRKTSIDELPQFLNVLRGEMTLVGPRPPLAYEVEYYTPRDWLRLSGKPGLTGLWQVHGRSQVPFRDMVEMDITYLQRQSFWEDLKLIASTPIVMIFRRGGA